MTRKAEMAGLVDILKAITVEDGCTICEHSPEEIGLAVIQCHEALLQALSAETGAATGPWQRVGCFEPQADGWYLVQGVMRLSVKRGRDIDPDNERAALINTEASPTGLSAETGAGDFVLVPYAELEDFAHVIGNLIGESTDPGSGAMAAQYRINRMLQEHRLTAHESTPKPGGDER